ncbi:MAG: DUF1353 domain-containing protein [bacterium]
MSRFTDALVVSPLADGKTWILMRPFGYEVGAEGSGNIVDCKIGFMTDFASIPRIFWWILPKWGEYGNAAVIHDWLYWNQERSRSESDKIMFEAMGILSVPAWKKHAIYWIVWIFGFMAWKRNKLDKSAGFNRIMSTEKIKAIQLSGRSGLLRRMVEHYMKSVI